MKIYRELYFKGTEEQLIEFTEKIKEYAVGDWKYKIEEKYLSFSYTGDILDSAIVFIYLGEDIKKGKIKVVNIVPTKKSSLTIEEYNLILIKFYNDVIKPFKEDGTVLNISEPSDDEFNPTSIISETALKKLKTFCLTANKSTGASHPCDQERWFDFICQTVDDEKMFDSTTLSNFLQDESYWGKKPKDFIGCIGAYAWSEDKANELALDYENSCELLKYYKKKKDI